MTQDQYGQAQGTGYVVRGEVVPDDDAGLAEDEQSGPMTRLRKVASAMRGDRPDQTIPDDEPPTSADEGPVTPDPNGAWVPRPGEPSAMSSPVAEDDLDDEASPGDVDTARSPEADSRDYWDNDTDRTGPGGAATTATLPDAGTGAPATTPIATGGSSYATTAPPAGADRTVPSPAYGGQADLGVPAGDGVAAGRHAVGDAGLRPGEATDRLGDFGDIAFGNLLPDAAQYTAQWQQIQFRFVDDPQASVTEAADVISQVTIKLEAAIRERQRAIEERQQAIQERASALRGRWGEGSNADTETLRETLRMYRAFMDQLIGPTA
jgi:hypothetical protein